MLETPYNEALMLSVRASLSVFIRKHETFFVDKVMKKLGVINYTPTWVKPSKWIYRISSYNPDGY